MTCLSVQHEGIQISGCIDKLALYSLLHGNEWSGSRPDSYTPGQTAAGTHWIGCWEGPRAGLVVLKNRTFCGFAANRTVSSSPNQRPSQYQDCTIRAHTCNSDTRNSAHGSEVLRNFNPLNAELNPICCLLALLGAYHFLHVSRIRVKSLTLRLLMLYIWSTYSWCF